MGLGRKIKHILLLDDEQSVRFALKLLLEALGYTVTDFKGPEEAVAHLKVNTEADLFICDLRMPVMSGLQVLEHAGKLAPHIPFVLMSAHAQDNEIQKAKVLGMAGMLSKPFTPDDLEALVRSLEE